MVFVLVLQEVISCQKAVSDSKMADSASKNSSDSTCSSCAKMKEVCLVFFSK